MDIPVSCSSFVKGGGERDGALPYFPCATLPYMPVQTVQDRTEPLDALKQRLAQSQARAQLPKVDALILTAEPVSFP